MKTQILDRNMNVVSENNISTNSYARVTYARAKYFEHNGTLPKSEIVPAHVVFNS